MNELIGHSSTKDVSDCIAMTKLCLSKFAPLIDEHRVGVYGASHGGFLAAWMIAKPESCDLFQVALLSNAIFNLNYEWITSDVPDWVFACFFGTDPKLNVTNEEYIELFRKSPY